MWKKKENEYEYFFGFSFYMPAVCVVRIEWKESLGLQKIEN